MATVLITAHVEDSSRWEQGFRSHADLFKNPYAAQSVRFTSTADNEVATLWQVPDAKKFLEHIGSQETIDAMAHDSVKRDTVKVFVIDQDMNL